VNSKLLIVDYSVILFLVSHGLPNSALVASFKTSLVASLNSRLRCYLVVW